MTGIVKKINVEKGFGFILDQRTGVEYFFHRTALKNVDIEKLTSGQEVTFEDSEGTKGPRAEDVYV